MLTFGWLVASHAQMFKIFFIFFVWFFLFGFRVLLFFSGSLGVRFWNLRTSNCSGGQSEHLNTTQGD